MINLLLGGLCLLIAACLFLAPTSGILSVIFRLWHLERLMRTERPQLGKIALWGRIEQQTAACESLLHGPCVWRQSTLTLNQRTESESPDDQLARLSTTACAPSWIIYDGGKLPVDLSRMEQLNPRFATETLTPERAKQHSAEFVKQHGVANPQQYYQLEEKAVPSGSSVLLVGSLCDPTEPPSSTSDPCSQEQETDNQSLFCFIGSRQSYWWHTRVRLIGATILTLCIGQLGLCLLVQEILRIHLLH